MKSNLFKVLIAGALMIFSWNARAAVPIPPSITTQPADQNVSCHDTATFTVVATGSPPLSYIWTANGLPVSSPVTNATLTVTNVLCDSVVVFSVIVTNFAGAVMSEPALLTVTNKSKPALTISLNPTNTTNIVNVTDLTDLANIFNIISNNVNNVTNVSSLSQLATLTETISWPSECAPPVLRNLYLSVPSVTNWATLLPITAIVSPETNQATVLRDGKEQLYTLSTAAPHILNILSTQSVAVLPGSNVTFTVVATNGLEISTYPLRYYWQLNGIALPNETNSSITLTNVQRANGGSYSVVVGNDVDAVPVAPATLIIQANSIPLTNAFANRTIATDATNAVNGSNVNATKEAFEPNHAGVIGGKSVWLGWKAPGSGIVTFDTKGSTFDTVLAVYTNTVLNNLTLIASDDDSGGFYTSKVQFNAIAGVEYEIAIDGFGAASGNIALNWSLESTSDEIPVILTQPRSQTVLQGTNSLPFTVVAGPSLTTLTYQWKHNGSVIPGATDSSYTISNAQQADLGSYTVVVSTPTRSIESIPAFLELEQRSGTFVSEPPDAGPQLIDKLEIPNDSSIPLQLLNLNNSQSQGAFVKIVSPPVGGSTTVSRSNGGLTQGWDSTMCGQKVGGTLYATALARTTGTIYFYVSGAQTMQVFQPNYTYTPCASSFISCQVQYPNSYYSITIGTAGPGSSVSLTVGMQ